ncbi:hypothetical protein L6452_44014 [Arctium lappa]|uniref:Uncharacterized protein n=1 Tax=Arctium lappa TaxID=4217 RepID=A0ACB8XEG8_ARCLA|nr:hypothetical protein L6452_44014 [Arctium lappa]
MAASAQSPIPKLDGILFSPQQLEQLAKLMPQLQMASLKDFDTNADLDNHFSGMISCHHTHDSSDEWIIDLGASDHMTPYMRTESPQLRRSTRTHVPPLRSDGAFRVFLDGLVEAGEDAKDRYTRLEIAITGSTTCKQTTSLIQVITAASSIQLIPAAGSLQLHRRKHNI